MSVSAPELKSMLDRGEKLRLIDVREKEEWDAARIPAAELMPLSQFQQLAPAGLAPDEKIVLYCHHGIRSAKAQAYLRGLGYAHVLNLTGGIDAWSTQVDAAVKRY